MNIDEKDVEEIRDLVLQMDEQIGHLGETLGKLFWDLHYAYEAEYDYWEETGETDCRVLYELVAVWLSLPFTREIMRETYRDYEKHMEEE
tara:strand:- start:1877 stop:2146 length:270 start_codon:yes stop_codon:yes gene_type:complete